MDYRMPEATRLEIKFASYGVHYDAVLLWLFLHPARFIEAFPDRWVNNVYFDTHNYASFSQNLSGVSSRTKIRYRWYGTEQGPATGVLEVKCKRNYFGWKARYKIATSPYRVGSSWRLIREEMLEQLSPEGKKWLHANPLPALINRYQRKYFTS